MTMPAGRPEPAALRAGIGHLSVARLALVLIGAAGQVLLPRLFGAAAPFGLYAVAMGWLQTIGNVVGAATERSVSLLLARPGAADPAAAARSTAAALRVQLALGAAVAAAFFIAAPWLAAAVQGDGRLAWPLRLCGLTMLALTVYSMFTGAANGQLRFRRQGRLDIAMALLRLLLALAAAWRFHDPTLAVGGVALATLLIALFGALSSDAGLLRRLRGAAPHGAELALYLLVTAYFAGTNLLRVADLLWLRRALPVGPAGDTALGVYGAAHSAAALPLHGIVVINAAFFPLLAQASGDRERARRLTAAALRLALLLLGAGAVGLGARPAGTLRLIYPAPYVEGAALLPPLLLGTVETALLLCLGNALLGLGAVRRAAALVGLPLLALLGVLPAARALAPGLAPAAAAAWLKAALLLLGLGTSPLWLRGLGAGALPCAARALAATAAGLLLSRLWPAGGGRPGTLLCAILSVAAYGAALLLLGEVRRGELRALLSPAARPPVGSGGGTAPGAAPARGRGARA